MTMPLLPALMGVEDPNAPPPVSLADIVSQLDDDQVNELVATAEAAGFGEAPAAPVEGEEAAPESEEGEPVEDDGEVTEEDGAEEGDEQLVEEKEALGLDAVESWASTTLEDLDVQLERLNELSAAADDNAEAGADPEAIGTLVEQAEELIERANEAYDECKDAVKSEDARACAMAGLRIERIHRVLLKLVDQATAYAETTDTPEAGPMDDPAMKLWLERSAPKGGPI